MTTLASGRILVHFMESERGSRHFHLEISFCFVASLSKCMSSPSHVGWSFDFWSALICTRAQHPWEITHHCRTLIRFLLISVSVRGMIMVSLFFRRPIFPGCHICSLQHCRDGSAELGDFLRASPFASHNHRYLILSEFIAFVTHVALNANTLVSIPPRFPHRTCRLLPSSAHSVLHQLPHLLTKIHFPPEVSQLPF